MHHNYYFLRQLTDQLRAQVLGWRLGACFSQNKDELIVGLYEPSGGGEFYIKAHLASNFCCLHFPDSFHRAKRNSVDLFSGLLDQPLTEVCQFENERSFWLRFGDRGLLFKMHGNRANVLLTEGQQVVKIFRNSLAKDLSLDIATLNRSLNPDRAAHERAEGDVRTLYPTFGPLPRAYLQEQGYEEGSREEQWQLLQSLLTRLKQPERYYLIEWDNTLHLSLLPLGDEVGTADSPIAAVNEFFHRKIKRERTNDLRGQSIQRLEKQLRQGQQYLRKSRSTLEKLETGRQYQQTADILMANLHQIPEGATEVELFDFYHNEPALIRLSRHLSPQKNAERYYRKAKNQKIEVDQLQKNIARKEAEQSEISAHLEALRAMDDPRELQQYLQEHTLLPDTARENAPFPFRRFDLDGYAVWVGKSARNNDELLRNHAHKEDLWLHAKDVSGSHVLIKPRAGQPVPPYIIEQAARIAAYYSKRKTDTLCPVIVTPRKYVRKSKNMAPGAVVVEREEVIMVEPGLPDSTSH